MKLVSITIENFQIHRSFSATLTDMSVFCGLNRTGKTCLRDAIEFCLTGKAMRGLVHKKDLKSLVSRGAKKGHIEVDFDDGTELKRDVSSGRVTAVTDVGVVPIDEPMDNVRFVTDMHAFSNMKEDEKRVFLFRLANIKTDVDAICEMLIDNGNEKSIVHGIVKPLLRSGFAAAEQEMRIKAREQKASWRAITGETYGSEKAETWKPDSSADALPENIVDQIRAADKLAAEALGRLDTLMQDYGKKEQIEQEREKLKKEITLNEADAVMLMDRTETYNRLSSELLEEEDKLADASKLLHNITTALSIDASRSGNELMKSPANTWHSPCPNCGMELSYKESDYSLIPFIPDIEKENENKDRQQSLIHDIQMKITALRTDTAEAQNLLLKAQQADAVVKEYRNSLSTLPAPEELDRNAIDALQAEVEQHRKEAGRLRELRAEKAREGDKEMAAKVYHNNTKKCLAIADALSPSGIQKKLLDDALLPINIMLAEICQEAQLPTIIIRDDMGVLVDGELYHAQSESMQWRADAVLSVAFAKLSGVGFVVLDRLDVLDMPSRGKMVNWLYIIRKDVQSIVMATLKAPPPARDGMAVTWLKGGVQ